MKYVKLVKGIDYRGHGVKAFSGKPLDVDDDKAEVLVGTGFFVVDSTVTSEEKPAEQTPLEKMKKEELIAYAKENGIDISACTKNEERVETIKAAIAAKAENDGAKAGFEE